MTPVKDETIREGNCLEIINLSEKSPAKNCALVDVRACNKPAAKVRIHTFLDKINPCCWGLIGHFAINKKYVSFPRVSLGKFRTEKPPGTWSYLYIWIELILCALVKSRGIICKKPWIVKTNIFEVTKNKTCNYFQPNT